MERRLRIAIISAHSCPLGTLGTKDTGGMSVYTVEIARELGKSGHTVDVYTRTHDPADMIEVELGNDARLIHIKAGKETQINKLDVYSHLPDFADNLENYRKSNNLEYDLIFSHYWLSGWVGEYLSRWWNVPHITMFHTLGAVKNTFGIGEAEPELRIQSERELARTVNHIIAPTYREKAELVNRYGTMPERISIVPCGVNTELFSPMDREKLRMESGLSNSKIILYVGRINPLKGISNLIQAVSHLKTNGNIKLMIVGGEENDRMETEKLGELSRELGIEDRVVFTGPIKQDRMPYFYNIADVCVIPSYYESFGLVALESLSCGTLIVANNVGDLKNIVRQGETGYVTDSNMPEELADKIELILEKSTNGKYPFSSARESVMKFSWTNVARALADEFKIIMDNYWVSTP